MFPVHPAESVARGLSEQRAGDLLQEGMQVVRGLIHGAVPLGVAGPNGRAAGPARGFSRPPGGRLAALPRRLAVRARLHPGDLVKGAGEGRHRLVADRIRHLGHHPPVVQQAARLAHAQCQQHVAR